jgi:hypothetical protein
MAQRTQVLLIDDLDGAAAAETVAFGLDGSTYEIDLSEKNATQLRESLADYVAHGRKAALIRTNSLRRTASHISSGPDTADVRSWARSAGYAVNERGRIASEVMEAYRAAH